jgi:hypothetical protein
VIAGHKRQATAANTGAAILKLRFIFLESSQGSRRIT